MKSNNAGGSFWTTLIDQERLIVSHYLDVHTHLTHALFQNDLAQVIQRAEEADLRAIIVNGLAPSSNRQILAMAQQHSIVKAALGIYPTEAVNDILPDDFHLEIEKFTLLDEINFIREQAKNKTIIAIGECGLDAHHLGEDTFPQQEKVFIELLEIASDHDLPVIVHSRKRETRCIEILKAHGMKKVDMHCFGGKAKLALETAESEGWCFSIPAHVIRTHSFQKLVQLLPVECLLTETDAPYLPAVAGTRCEPSDVVTSIECMAKLKHVSIETMKATVWENYKRIFEK